MNSGQRSEKQSGDPGLLERIVDSLPDGVLAVDREGKVVVWNRAVEEMTGVQAISMPPISYFYMVNGGSPPGGRTGKSVIVDGQCTVLPQSRNTLPARPLRHLLHHNLSRSVVIRKEDHLRLTFHHDFRAHLGIFLRHVGKNVASAHQHYDLVNEVVKEGEG